MAQARRMVDGYGFSALKLKGGVFPPDQEAEAIRALRRAFPDHPLRLDPNAAWTPETSIRIARDDPPGRRHPEPGLGAELDRDALARQHEQYLACGLRRRDDTGYMQSIDPGYERKQPRW